MTINEQPNESDHHQIDNSSGAATRQDLMHLLAFTQILLSETDPKKIMRAAVQTIARALDVDMVGIMLPENKLNPRFLVLQAQIGGDPKQSGKLKLPIDSSSGVGHVYQQAEALVIEDFSKETRFSPHPIIEDLGIKSGIIVPMMIRERAVGVMGIAYLQPRQPAPDDSRLMILIANATAQALEQGRLFSALIDSETRYKTLYNGVKAIDETRRRYEFIANTAGDFMTLIDQNYVYQAANDAYCRAQNKPREAIIGSSVADIWGKPRFETKIKTNLDRCFSGKELNDQAWLEFPALGWCYVEISYFPFRDKEDQITHCVVITRDITQQERAESENRLLAKFPAENPNPVIRIASDGTIIYANAASEPLLKSWQCQRYDLLPNELHEIVINTRQSGLTREIEWTVDRKIYLFTLTPVTDAGYLNLYGRDVTDRVQAESHFRSLLETAPDGIIVVDENGIIQQVNTRTENIFGYRRDELLDKPIEMLVPTHSRNRHVQHRAKFNAGHFKPSNHRTMELTGLHKNGNEFPVEISLSTFETNTGNLTTTILRDIADRKQAEQEIQRRAAHLEALHTIDIAISGSMDLGLTLSVLLEQISIHLKVDAATVLLYNPFSQTLEFSSQRGFRTQALKHTHLRLGNGPAGQAALERRVIHISNLEQSPDTFNTSPSIQREGFVSYLGVPLVAQGQLEGILEIFHRKTFTPSDDWMELLEAMATQAAIAINNANLFQNLQQSNTELSLAYDTTLEGWARALELRDQETEGHTRRVAELTERLARQMNVNPKELVHIRRGALLHDIGKMGIPDSILLKDGELSEEEWEIMRQHPQHAYEMLLPIPFLRSTLDIPHCHHEKWDGSGYPRGLRGEQIPLAARIFAIVDVWDALTSDRPYREAWSNEKALTYIRQQSGKHFDPAVAKAFLEMSLHLRK